MLFLLHPSSIATLRLLSQLVSKFHSFIFAFEAPPGTVPVEIARNVISEMLNSSQSGFRFQGWVQFLEEWPKKLESTLDGMGRPFKPLQPSLTYTDTGKVFTQLLAAASPPEDPKEPLLTLMHELLEAIKPLADSSAPTDLQPEMRWDIITRARVPCSKPTYRRCTRCGNVSELGIGNLPEDLTGFALFCTAWRTKCICGGLWMRTGK